MMARVRYLQCPMTDQKIYFCFDIRQAFKSPYRWNWNLLMKLQLVLLNRQCDKFAASGQAGIEFFFHDSLDCILILVVKNSLVSILIQREKFQTCLSEKESCTVRPIKVS